MNYILYRVRIKTFTPVVTTITIFLRPRLTSYKLLITLIPEPQTHSYFVFYSHTLGIFWTVRHIQLYSLLFLYLSFFCTTFFTLIIYFYSFRHVHTYKFFFKVSRTENRWCTSSVNSPQWRSKLSLQHKPRDGLYYRIFLTVWMTPTLTLSFLDISVEYNLVLIVVVTFI